MPMQESRRLGHNYVGTEMLLVGVVAVSCLSIQFRGFGIGRDSKSMAMLSIENACSGLAHLLSSGHLRAFGQSSEEVQRDD